MTKKPTARPRANEPADRQLFSLRLRNQLWAEVSVFAKLKDKSMNELLGEVIEEWWAKQPEKPSVSRLVRASGASRTDKGEAS